MATEGGVPDPLIKRGGGRGERGGVVEHLSTVDLFSERHLSNLRQVLLFIIFWPQNSAVE